MRSSVNKNIAKPLQEVLLWRQNLWQVSQIKAFLYNEPPSKYEQDVYPSNEVQGTGKCLAFESTECRYSAGDLELTSPNAQHLVDKRRGQGDEGRTCMTTVYIDSSYFDREDVEHCCAGPNRVCRVLSYHTSSCGDRECGDSPKSNCKGNIDSREDYYEYDGSKGKDCDNEYSIRKESSHVEHNERLKYFTEGVMNKIKQNCYTSNPSFNYKPLNIRDPYGSNTVKYVDSFPTDDQPYRESEKEYVRSIINGIPCQSDQNGRSYDATAIYSKNPPNTSDYYKTCDWNGETPTIKHELKNEKRSLNNSLETPVQFGVAMKDSKKYSQDWHQQAFTDVSNESVSPKRKTGKTEAIPPRICPRVCESTVMEPDSYVNKDYAYQSQNHKSTANNKDYHACNYSLRNGFNESDVLKNENTSLNTIDRVTYPSGKSDIKSSTEDQQDSHTSTNGFYDYKLQEYRLNGIPTKPEYPIYKKDSSECDFKKYSKTKMSRAQKFKQEGPHNTIIETSGILPQSDFPGSTTQVTGLRSEPVTSSHQYDDKERSFSDRTANSNLTESHLRNEEARLNSGLFITNRQTLKVTPKADSQINKNEHLESTISGNNLKSKSADPYFHGNKSEDSDQTVSSLNYKRPIPSVMENCKPANIHNSSYTSVEKHKTSISEKLSIQKEKANDTESQTKVGKLSKDRDYTCAAANSKKDEANFERTKILNDQIDAGTLTTLNKKREQLSRLNKLRVNISNVMSPSFNLNNKNLGLKNENKNAFSKPVVYGKDTKDCLGAKPSIQIYKERGQSSKQDTLVKTEVKDESLQEKSKIRSQFNNKGDSKLSDIQTEEIKDLTDKDNKIFVKEPKATTCRDDAEITFPGITPPTFCAAVNYENGCKPPGQISSENIIVSPKLNPKTDIVENNRTNKFSPEKDIFKVSTTELHNLKCAQNENVQKNLGMSKNKAKSFVNVTQSSLKQEAESTDINKLSCSSLNKKGADDVVVKIGQMNSIKPVEFKKGVTSKALKEKTMIIGVREAQANQLSTDKIAAMLKEHRIILEMLLEKLNVRLPTNSLDSSGGTKKFIQHTDDVRDAERTSNSSGRAPTDEHFKNTFISRLSSQEKLKRLHPRMYQISPSEEAGAKEEKAEEEEAAQASEVQRHNFRWRDTLLPQDERGNPKLFTQRPLKRFHIVTMMTSPSGKVVYKKSKEILDGSKLSKYNYNPLRQILSQYSPPKSASMLTSGSKGTLLGSTVSRKRISHIFNTKKSSWRTFCDTTFLNMRDGSLDTNSNKDFFSHIRNTASVCQKRYHLTTDNIQKQNINLICKTQSKTILTNPKETKNPKKTNEANKKVDIEAGSVKANAGIVKIPDESFKLSKGVFFNSIKREFHKSSIARYGKPKNDKKYSISYATRIDNGKSKPLETSGRSLKEAEHKFKFIIRPSIYSMLSGTSDKYNIHTLEYSNNISKGPMWIDTPEYNLAKDQWKLPAEPKIRNVTDSRFTAKQENKEYSETTVDFLASVLKRTSLTKTLPLSSKATTSLALNESVLPLSSDNFKSANVSSINTNKVPRTNQISAVKLNVGMRGLQESKKVSKSISSFKEDSTRENSSLTKTNTNESNFANFKTEEVNKGSGKDCNYSVCNSTIRNSSLFSGVKKPDILNVIKPSLLSFRAMSYKDSSKLFKATRSRLEEGLNQIHLKRLSSKKTGIGGNYLQSMANKHPGIVSLKNSWTRVTNKVKHLLKSKLDFDNFNGNCCKPNFDEMLVSISKEMEKSAKRPGNKHCSEDDFSKQVRSKELSLVSDNGKRVTNTTRYDNGSSKVVIIPQFLEEGVKNF